MSKDKERKTFYYPSEKKDVGEWIKKQRNLSHSISELIKDEVKRSGINDYIDVKLSEKS